MNASLGVKHTPQNWKTRVVNDFCESGIQYLFEGEAYGLRLLFTDVDIMHKPHLASWTHHFIPRQRVCNKHQTRASSMQERINFEFSDKEISATRTNFLLWHKLQKMKYPPQVHG